MSVYLSQTDIERTTNRTKYTAQCKALDAMGIRYLRSPSGAPLVLASEVERVLSGGMRQVERRKELRF